MIQRKSKQEPQPQTQKKLNKDILIITYIFLGLFLIIVVYFAYLVGYSGRTLINNSYNKLLNLVSDSVTRGTVYSADGEILAATGVDDNNEEYRYYPYDEEYCHVVGSMDSGLSGLESAYNFELLSSNDSVLTKILNDFSDKKDNGNNLITTLDTRVTDAAYAAMNGYEGAAIVMDSKTGAVLAMVSRPGYNPNTIAGEWEEITESESSVLINRATQGLYTPGSIFKLITLYEYLKEGGSEDDYVYDCNGSTTVDGENIHCSSNTAHGTLTLADSFAYSCNCSFVNIGEKISITKLKNTCSNLLFQKKLPVKIEYNKSTFALSDQDSDFLKAQTVFGQGETLISPIHAAILVQAIANGGVAMEPSFVSKITDAKGSTVRTIQTKTYKTLFEPEMAQKLKSYMRGVVEYGTAQRLNHFDHLTVYGKTGSAEIDSARNINSWFIGFAENDTTGDSYTIVVVAENVAEGTSPAPAVSITNQILKVLD